LFLLKSYKKTPQWHYIKAIKKSKPKILRIPPIPKHKLDALQGNNSGYPHYNRA
jgi:hypothetical protein